MEPNINRSFKFHGEGDVGERFTDLPRDRWIFILYWTTQPVTVRTFLHIL